MTGPGGATLAADVSIAVVPLPFVVEAIPDEFTLWRGSQPEIVLDAGREPERNEATEGDSYIAKLAWTKALDMKSTSHRWTVPTNTFVVAAFNPSGASAIISFAARKPRPQNDRRKSSKTARPPTARAEA